MELVWSLSNNVGATVEQFNKMAQAHAVFRTYKTIPEHVLTGLGYTVTQTDVVLEPVTFDAPVATLTL